MEDNQIVALFWDRSEAAVAETAAKYAGYCHTIAYNILEDQGEADESVNDTYLAAWESIPPQRPAVLRTYLGKLTRRISLKRLRARNARKRGAGTVSLALEELAECTADSDVAAEVELEELARALDRFLERRTQEERTVFLGRYWYFVPLAELSGRLGCSQSRVKSMLHRMRKQLADFLKGEGLV